MDELQHIVIPGQIIATTDDNEDDDFLRGHGTYIENLEDPTVNSPTNEVLSKEGSDNVQKEDEYFGGSLPSTTQHLISSTAGIISRTNKVIQISQPNAPYAPQTGDPVVGRVFSVSASKWNVSLSLVSSNSSSLASLPLTGINLPDGMQRMRTSKDALSMREVLREGDLISAEVRTVQGSTGVAGGGNAVLHARSVRCGKLQNGCFVMVPNWLIARIKKHFVVLGGDGEEGFDGIIVEVLLGCNGGIWLQRAMAELDELGDTGGILEEVERIRGKHAKQVVTIEERVVIARLKNSIEALMLTYRVITPENILAVMKASVDFGYTVADMLRPEVILEVTSTCRKIPK